MAQGLWCTVGSGARRTSVCLSAVTVTAAAQGAGCFRASGKTSAVHHCWQGLPQPRHRLCCLLNVPLAGAVTSIYCSSVLWKGRGQGR